MNDWYSLGVALLVPVSKLKEIMTSCPQEGTARWRIDLLQHWLDSTPTASWSDIITALEKIGHHTLSARLRTKYLPSISTGMMVHEQNQQLYIIPMLSYWCFEVSTKTLAIYIEAAVEHCLPTYNKFLLYSL